MSAGTLQQTIAAYRARLLVQEAQALAVLAQAHQAALTAIQPQLDILFRAVDARLKTGETIPVEWLLEGRRLQTIKQLIEGQIGQEAALAQTQVGQLQQQGVALGAQAGMEALAATVPVGITHSFGVPDPAAIAQLVGATKAGGPLSDLFNGFGPEAAKAASDALIAGLTTGVNPRLVAQDVQAALNVPYNRAATIARTEMLRAYRGAQIESYRANDDVVAQWRWTAALSPRTCFPAGTRVETETGPKPIEQIELGEKVLTHTGKYQRVLVHSITSGIEQTTTIRTATRAVSATLDHPFLVEREGQLDWIEASDLRLGDHVFCQTEGDSHVVNHRSTDRTIEWSIGQTYHPIAARLQPERFSNITLLNACQGMPVCPVDLKTCVECGQIEINGITPARESMFLRVFDAQYLEAEPRIPLGFCFARKLAVASHATEKSISYLSRAYAKLLTAIFTGMNDSRASAFLRAVLNISFALPKDFSTAFAGNGDCASAFAGIGTIDLVLFARRNSEYLTTGRTDNLRALMLRLTDFRTVVSFPFTKYTERLTASFANEVNLWLCLFASSSMRMFSLIERIAVPRAEPARPFSIPRGGDCEWTIALNTNLFHSDIITEKDIHFHPSVPVYNLEVEEDHSYVANGFLVHNCAACLAMDGSLHDLSEDMESHPNCRCTQTPVTNSWSDILAGTGIDTSDIPDGPDPNEWQIGADWFAKQDTSVQRGILGKAAYQLYANGDITLQDVVGHASDPQWGGSIYQKPVKELIKS